MLIKGSDLTPAQRTEVLAAYVHRWTFERAAELGECPGCRQRRQSGASMTIKIDGQPDKPWHEHHVPLVSDEVWLREHSFHFTKGGRLSRRHHWAEPASLAAPRTAEETYYERVISRECPRCRAPAGRACTDPRGRVARINGTLVPTHRPRLRLADKEDLT